MKALFSVHAGEYLVGSHIEKTFRNWNVWLPSKDTGIDLLITNSTNSKAVSLQVKFSKDFHGTNSRLPQVIAENIRSGCWWTFNPAKIRDSKADLWVLVLYSFVKKTPDFVVIEPRQLSEMYKQLGRKGPVIHTYLWVTNEGKCWETRALNKKQLDLIAMDQYSNTVRDLSPCLNNWSKLREWLGKPNSRTPNAI